MLLLICASLVAELQGFRSEGKLISAAIRKVVESYFDKISSTMNFALNTNNSEVIDSFERVIRSYKKSISCHVLIALQNQVLKDSTVYMYDSFADFWELEQDRFEDYVMHQNTPRVRSLIYCRKSSSLEIETFYQNAQKTLKDLCRYCERGLSSGLHLLSFLVEESSEITLNVLTFFTPRNCGLIQLQEINKFSKLTLKWTTNQFFIPKVNNHHGCQLNFDMEITDPGSQNELIAGCDGNGNDRKPTGYAVLIAKILANTFNYTAKFRSCNVNISNQDKSPTDLSLGQLTPLREYLRYGRNIGYPIFNDHYVIVVPPGDSYTALEKVFLPFDWYIWIGFLTTFLVAYTVVFVINRFMSQQVADFIFGRGVTTPSLNIFATFMGIGAVKLPGRNFARFLLMSFILYCLIMRYEAPNMLGKITLNFVSLRTAYQGKYFEFLTGDIRKRGIQTVEEIMDKNIPIYYNYMNSLDFKSIEMFEG